jgi:hypothetical protein
VPAEDDVSHRSLRVEHGPLLFGLAACAIAAGGIAVCGLAACGAAQTPDENSIEALAATVPVPSASASADADATEKPKWNDKSEKAPPPSADEGALNDAQKEQMEVALRRGGDKAANCSTVVPDAVKGEAEIKVTFDGKKGRATDVAVGPPWAGTDAESCIKRAFIGEIVVPFDGQLEVPYTVRVGPKPVDDKAKDKGAKGKTQGKDTKGKKK